MKQMGNLFHVIRHVKPVEDTRDACRESLDDPVDLGREVDDNKVDSVVADRDNFVDNKLCTRGSIKLARVHPNV